jgi:cyclase
MPCLLLKGWGLVKTVKFQNPTYVGDPINTVRIYNEKEVDELIFLDITATPRQAEPPYQVIEEIAAECFMPFTYGGGVRDLETLRRIFSLGVEKVAINTQAVENPDLIEQAADRFGSQSIVVSIDVKQHLFGRYRVHTHGGRQSTSLEPAAHARAMQERGAGEILLTSIDRDGTFSGYDVELIRQVSQAVSIPVIACGGAGGVADFTKAVREGGASAVAAGSMVVYQGPHRAVLINFPDKAALKAALP